MPLLLMFLEIIYLLNSDVYRGNQLWETLAFDLKNSSSQDLFKNGIKNWRCIESLCQICSRFLAGIEYI